MGGLAGNRHSPDRVVLIIVVCVLAVVSAVALWGAQEANRNADKVNALRAQDHREEISNDHTQHAAELAQCQRVQDLRVRINANALVIYRALGAITQLHTTQHDQDESHSALRQLEQARALLAYQPPVNCHLAVEHPLTYTIPAPIPYSKR